jgi:ankyrin repeat protein
MITRTLLVLALAASLSFAAAASTTTVTVQPVAKKVVIPNVPVGFLRSIKWGLRSWKRLEFSLVVSAGEGNIARVKMLLSYGVNPNAQSIYAVSNGKTALMRAAGRGHTEVVKILLAAGANVKERDDYGLTALGWATVRYSYYPLAAIQLLLEAGAQVNNQDCKGYTALHHTAARGYTDAVKILLKFGADKTIKNTADQTAYDVAANDEIRALLK